MCFLLIPNRYFPENADLHTTLGLLYMQTGKHQQAFEHLGTTLTFEPQNTRAILAAGAMMQVSAMQIENWKMYARLSIILIFFFSGFCLLILWLYIYT